MAVFVSDHCLFASFNMALNNNNVFNDIQSDVYLPG